MKYFNNSKFIWVTSALERGLKGCVLFSLLKKHFLNKEKNYANNILFT